MMRLPAKLAFLCWLLLLGSAPVHGQFTFFRGAASSTATGVTPAFRAAASALTTGATLTISKPAGVVVNDVMIASVAVTPSSVVIAPPTGWTLVRRMDNAGPTSNSLAVFYKVATGGEPASYAWGVSGVSFSVGGIQAFSGVDTANPIAVENGQSTPSSTSHPTPNVTTAVGNAMVVTAHVFASSRSWTPPSGMTESFDRPSGANGATGLSIEGTRVLQPVAGASGAKTASAAGDADAGNAHILALRPQSVSLAIPKPAATARFDMMVAAVGFNNSSAVITAPAGWTLVRRMDNAGSTSNSLAVYYKASGNSEPASYAWSVAGGSYLVGGIQAFHTIDNDNPIDVENGQSTPSGTSHDTPSLMAFANSPLVTSHTYASSRTWTPEAGLSEGFDQPSGANSATGQSISGAYQMTGGAIQQTGPKRSTAAGFADVGNAHIIALRPGYPPPVFWVYLVSPEKGDTFTAPASITLTAEPGYLDGTIQKVEFFQGGTNLIATVTSPPYTVPWTNVPQGTYTVSAVATNNLGATTTSHEEEVTVSPGSSQLYFIHADHLNTPRLVADAAGTTVWKWDQAEPFGNNVADENPSGLGTFDLPLRLPGQYFDKETNLHYNYYRDYDPSIGGYKESDPIGLRGGMNTYAYVGANPIFYIDPLGLAKACTPGTDCPTLPPKNDPAWRPYSGASSVFHCGFSCYHENRKATPENPQGECCYDERDMLVDAKHKYAGCRGTPNQYPSSDPRHLWPDSGGIGKAGLPAFNESRRYDYENRRGNAGGGSTFHGAP